MSNKKKYLFSIKNTTVIKKKRLICSYKRNEKQVVKFTRTVKSEFTRTKIVDKVHDSFDLTTKAKPQTRAAKKNVYNCLLKNVNQIIYSNSNKVDDDGNT